MFLKTATAVLLGATAIALTGLPANSSFANQSSSDLSPQGEYEEAIQALWEESAIDSGATSGDLVGTWRSPETCFSGRTRSPGVTVIVYRQDGAELDAVLRGEMSDLSESTDPMMSPMTLDFSAHFTGSIDEGVVSLELQQSFSDWKDSSRKENRVGFGRLSTFEASFVDEVPEEFRPSIEECSTTYLKVSDDTSQASLLWQTFDFAHALREHAIDNRIHPGVIGGHEGGSFALPSCQGLASFADLASLNDRAKIGSHQVWRHFADDIFVPTFGVPVTALTDEQRLHVIELAAECYQQDRRNGSFRAASRIFGNERRAYLSLDKMLEHEKNLASIDAENILEFASDPKYLMFAMNRQLFERLHTNTRLDGMIVVDRRLHGLTKDHQEEFIARRHAFANLVAKAGARLVMAEHAGDEGSRYQALPKLQIIAEESPAGSRDALEDMITQYADDELQTIMVEISDLPAESKALELIQRHVESVEQMADAASSEILMAAQASLREKEDSVQEALFAAFEKDMEAAQAALQAAPATLEGWGQLEETRASITGMKVKHGHDGANLARIGQLETSVNEAAAEIQEATKERILSMVSEVGLLGASQYEEGVREAHLVFNDEDWLSDVSSTLRHTLIQWTMDEPSTAADQVRQDEEAFTFLNEVYQTSVTPDDVQEELRLAIIDRSAQRIRELATAAYGVDLGRPLEADDVLFVHDAAEWLNLLAGEAGSDGVNSWGAAEVIEAETEALARLMQEQATDIYAAYFSDLRQEDVFRTDWSEFMLTFMDGADSYRPAGSWLQESRQSPRMGAATQHKSERGQDWHLVIDGSVRVVGPSEAPRTWADLGYAEVDQAVADAAQEAALQFSRDLVSHMEGNEGEVEEMISSILSGRGLDTVLLEVAIWRAFSGEQVEELASVHPEVSDQISRFNGIYADRMRAWACREPLEEAGLSEKDRARLIMSSGGQSELLEAFVCKMSAMGYSVLDYSTPGFFGSEHELMFETSRGDVLTAVLVEAEVRPGEKMLVGKAMEDATSRTDISATEWREQVDEMMGDLRDL